MFWELAWILLPAFTLSGAWIWINRATTPSTGNLALAAWAMSAVWLVIAALRAAF